MMRRKVTKKSDERERVNKREIRLRRNIRDGLEGARGEIEQRERNYRKNEIKMTREKGIVEKEGKEKQKVDKNKRQQRESNNEQG